MVCARKRTVADAVIIEKNQGGDICCYTLETVRREIPIIKVHATHGADQRLVHSGENIALYASFKRMSLSTCEWLVYRSAQSRR